MKSREIESLKPIQNASGMDNFTADMLEAEKENQEEERKVFLVSGMGDISTITEALGKAEVRSSGEYDSSVTHIVINKVTRSEKMLCCTVGGKWVLHPSYVTDSHKVSGWGYL